MNESEMVIRIADEIKRLVRQCGCPDFDNAEYVAEGVLEVMREPTQQMRDAVYDYQKEHRRAWSDMSASEIWEIMTVAALKEQA